MLVTEQLKYPNPNCVIPEIDSETVIRKDKEKGEGHDILINLCKLWSEKWT